MDRLEAHRIWFAQLVTANAGVMEQKLRDAFASTPRERSIGAGPWQVFTRIGYIPTPSDDPAFLQQDITVALKREQQINNGQPTLNAGATDPLAGRAVLVLGPSLVVVYVPGRMIEL